MFPKQGKRPRKLPKWLRRSQKRIAPKAKFKADWEDGKRSRWLSDAEVWRRAREKQAERLREATEEENALAAILLRLGVVFEREKIIQNGDRFVLLDFYVPSVKLCIEVDGFQHHLNRRYDAGRSMWLAKKHSIKTARCWNSEVMDGIAEHRIREMLGLPR
jgi:very-short-patch-repair endonuclease